MAAILDSIHLHGSIKWQNFWKLHIQKLRRLKTLPARQLF